MNLNLVRRTAPATVVAVLLLAASTVSLGGTFSYLPITNDADSGIINSKTYTHKLDFGEQTAFPVAMIGGVKFDKGTPGSFGNGSTNLPASHGGNGAHNVSGNVANLFGDMLYNAAAGKITLTGLTIGQTYDLRLYTRNWDGSGNAFNRTQRFDYETNGTGGFENTVTLNPDDSSQTPPGFAPVTNRAYAMSYAFTAERQSIEVNITDVNGNATYHLYGLTNELTGPTVAATRFEISKVWNTGVNNQGLVLAPGAADPHYTITQVPAGEPFSTPGAAVVQSNHPAWLGNDAVGTKGSSFTSTVSDGTASTAEGTYRTRLNFDLGGWNHSTVAIRGQAAVDNAISDVLLNGTSLGITVPVGASAFNSFNEFVIPQGSPFLAGGNTLDFVWTNGPGGAGPGGLRVEYVATGERLATQAIPGLFNTGVDNAGVPLPNNANSIDPHYTLTVNPNNSGASAHVENESVFPIVAGPWLANSASSKWIAPVFDTSGAAGGDYTYETTFDLTGFYADTAEIHGNWASDNEGLLIFLNGNPVDAFNNQLAAYDQFTIPVGSGFLPGLNTLRFQLNNDGGGYTGLRVDGIAGTAVAAVAIPEPTTAVLLLLGVATLATRRRASPA